MLDLEKMIGPFSLRVWGLILNFIGNALMLYGAAQYIKGVSSPLIMIIGIVITVVCILVLAKPQK